MAKQPQSILGIDIGVQAIKGVQLKCQGKKSVITHVGWVPTPTGAVNALGILDAAEISTALKELFDQAGFTTRQMVLSLSGQNAIFVRALQIPPLAGEALKEMMAKEMAASHPFGESKTLMDYCIYPAPPGSSSSLDAVFAIASELAVSSLQDLIKESGKSLFALDIEPLALGRSLDFNYGQEIQGQTICLVDFGHTKTSINIYRDSKLLMPRQLPIGGFELTRLISENFHLSLEEAEEIKKKRVPLLDLNWEESFSSESKEQDIMHESQTESLGVDIPYEPYSPFSSYEEMDQEEQVKAVSLGGYESEQEYGQGLPLDEGSKVTLLQNSIRFALEEFAGEIRRSIEYFSYQQGKVDRLLLCGGVSNIKNIEAYFSKTVGLPCEKLNPFRSASLQTNPAGMDLIEQHSQEFAVAMGNALYVVY